MKIFGSKLENRIKWDGKLQCIYRIFMTGFVKKSSYFNYSGGSEFSHPINVQIENKKGLEKFKKKKIK